MSSAEKVITFPRPVLRTPRWCEKCDTKSELNCNCGVGFLTAGQRAARAVAANPEKSDVSIAKDIGVSDMTVGRARKASTSTNVEVEKRVGRDGRARRAPAKARRAPAADKAMAIIRPLFEAQLPIITKTLEAEHGISRDTFERVIWKLEGERDARADVKIDPATLSLTAQEKLASAERQMRRRIEAEYAARTRDLDEEIRQRVLAEGKEYLATLHEMREEAADTKRTFRDFMDRQVKIFSKDDFRLIMLCVHGDASISDEKRGEATRLLLTKRFALTGEK